MNIFAKIIITTQEELKNGLIERLELSKKETQDSIEVFSKLTDNENIVLLSGKKEYFSQMIEYVKQNYEITKILYLGHAIYVGDFEMQSGDVMVPNTIINEENNAFFFEYIIDKNYDLKKFGLILNGICLSKKDPFQSEEEVLKFQQEYFADIIDFESYYLAEIITKENLEDKTGIVQILSTGNEFNEHGIDIIELML